MAKNEKNLEEEVQKEVDVNLGDVIAADIEVVEVAATDEIVDSKDPIRRRNTQKKQIDTLIVEKEVLQNRVKELEQGSNSVSKRANELEFYLRKLLGL